MSQRHAPPFDRPEPMAAADYLSHRGETSPRWRSSIVTIETLDQVPDADTLRRNLERATRTIPRLRQKVVAPLLPTTAPRWVLDTHFDLDFHLRRVSLPTPGGQRELLDLAEVIIQTPFDQARPLWTMTVVEGFAGDQAALVTHHSQAVTDGSLATLMLHEFYDDGPQSPTLPMPPAPKASDIGSVEVTRAGLAALPGATVSRAKSLVGGAFGAFTRLGQDPFVVLTSSQRYVESARRLVGPSALPVSPALNHRGLRSRSTSVEVDMADLRAAATRSGTTVNDAFLATVCGAARLYHQGVRRPVEAISISVPVNMRTVVDRLAATPTTGILIAAPVAESDPGERMRLVHRLLLAGRIEPVLGALDALAPIMRPLPDPVLNAVAELRPVPDVQVRHVRGPRPEKFVAGARVLRAYLLCPRHRVAVMATLTSRAGRATITTRYDVAAVVHQDAWEEALAGAVAEVVGYGAGGEPVVVAPPAIAGKPRPRRARRPGPAPVDVPEPVDVPAPVDVPESVDVPEPRAPGRPRAPRAPRAPRVTRTPGALGPPSTSP
ncbi:MAG: wax ester/triacylglycerol synthase family O-acyltransferase [Austwickia sp.]|nr:wax ester/triacylglycerol synthase family O-acyltransferase [Austwickia sp.]MBK8437473.1 wax ester/triacylglycerol synthase family O-acyltransferase [Austwickia sp.]MBK9102738.1 wax ester/triacylglycerol synthase family O-acyltransferase [Austwickia sp.]